jgi:hypothetical protein
VKTDDLIDALVQDRATRSPKPRSAIALALIAGAVAAGIVFMLALHVRPDIVQAAGTYRFLLKIVLALTLAASAIYLALDFARPEAASGRQLGLIAVAPAMLAAATIAELVVMPQATWMPGMMGIKPVFCLVMIFLLSIGPLLAFLTALRYGAPASPGLSGALAGLASGGIASAIFVIHCPNDSPLFVIVWYSLAIGLVTLVGYLAGRRWLRW